MTDVLLNSDDSLACSSNSAGKVGFQRSWKIFCSTKFAVPMLTFGHFTLKSRRIETDQIC